VRTIVRPDPGTARLARRALREIAPVLVAVLPLGWALGVATAASPLGGVVGWSGGPLLLSGAAHFALLSAYASGAGAVLAVVGALTIASRAVLYSAALADALAEQPRWFRLVAPYFLIDQMFVLTDGWIADGARGAELRRRYLIAGGALWITWVVAIGTGMVAGPLVPDGWRVELVLVALLVALARRALAGRAAVVALVTAAAVAVPGSLLPAGLGTIVATVAGIVAATRVAGRAEGDT
jgi:predicted branched-subunit amino acid permease